MSFPRIDRTAVYLALAAAPLLVAFDPAKTWWFPSCPLRALTGWLCPLCGTLRALHALFHGDPGAALALNPLATVGVFAGLAALVHDAIARDRSPQLEKVVGLCFSARGLALLSAFGVVRNMPRVFGWIT